MVRGVPGPALRALLRRWGELNGSGWYEIVTDPGLRFAKVRGILMVHEIPTWKVSIHREQKKLKKAQYIVNTHLSF